jgi:hypothetical protein
MNADTLDQLNAAAMCFRAASVDPGSDAALEAAADFLGVFTTVVEPSGALRAPDSLTLHEKVGYYTDQLNSLVAGKPDLPLVAILYLADYAVTAKNAVHREAAASHCD